MEIDEIALPAAEPGQPFQESNERPATASQGRSILLNFGSLSAGAFVSRLMGLATNAVLARRVSATGYGITGIAQTATVYFWLLSELGLGTVAVREGAQHPEKLQRVISSMVGLRLALACIAALLGLIVSPYLPFSDASRSLFRMYLLTLPIQALSVECVFRAVQRMHWNTVLQIAGAALTLILTVLLVRQPSQVYRVAGIAAVAALATAFFGILVLGRQGYHSRPTFSMDEAKYFLGQSLPLCATTLAYLLYSQANNLILGAVRGEADVGLYTAATRLSQVFYQPIWLYFVAMAPALMQSWAQSPERARSLLSTSIRLTAIVSIGSGLLAATAGEWILAKIFGKSFAGSGQAFEIMIWTGVVIAIGHNWGELAVAGKKNRLLVQSTFLGAVVNLAVCAATVSRMGIRGAALGNLLAEVAVHVMLIGSFGWSLGFKLLQYASKPALAGTAAYAVSLLTRSIGPPVCATVTVLSFLALLFFIREITAGDLKRLQALLPMRRVAPEPNF
jgi:O-antigen/teichoic acid export membrane protein